MLAPNIAFCFFQKWNDLQRKTKHSTPETSMNIERPFLFFLFLSGPDVEGEKKQIFVFFRPSYFKWLGNGNDKQKTFMPKCREQLPSAKHLTKQVRGFY